MKKIIILAILAISIFWNINYVNATEDTKVDVYVTEKIPWAWCEKDDVRTLASSSAEVEVIIYKCSIWKWATTIVSTIWAIIQYFTYIAGLIWVLFIVGNGIMYSMWWADQSLKDESKKRIIWTLLWLIILLLSGPILQIIAPWIYK